MTKNKTMEKVLMILLVIIILSSSINALGVTPARRLLNFEPGQLINYEISVLNSEEEEQILAVYATGDMAEYVTLERSIVRMAEDDISTKIKVSIKMPENFDPGTAKTKILITKLPEDLGLQDEDDVFAGNLNGNIGASLVVGHQLWVDVPYPGKYVKSNLRVQRNDESPEFVVSAYSLGTENIEELSARIEILGATYEELAEVKTNTISLAPGKEGKVVAVWKGEDFKPGVYRARAVLQYDGKTSVHEENFYLGASEIEIKELTINNFRLGSVAKFNALLESNWNNNIDGVYGEFNILQEGKLVSNFLTSPISIEPHAEETIIGYWDTEGFDIGNYDILVKVYYEEKTTEKLFDAVVSLDDIKLNSGASGLVTGQSSDNTKLSLLLIIVIGLVIANIGLFIYIRRVKK